MAIVYSRDVKDECLKVKIGCLEGTRPRPNYSQIIEKPQLKYSGLLDTECADLIVDCILESDGKQICPTVQTAYKHFTTQWNWNDWLEFPISICDLPRDTILIFKFCDSYGPSEPVVIGKAFVTIYGQLGAMRSGLYDLRVWTEDQIVDKWTFSGQHDLDRLYELKSHHHNGQMTKIDWLDKLTFLKIEKITQESKKSSQYMYISIEFPKVLIDNIIDGSIVYFETNGEEESYHRQQQQQQQTQQQSSNSSDIILIQDPELGLDNIIEGKHHKLSRSARSCISDKDIKPNASVRDQLNAIVSYPPTKNLTSEEQDLIWKFRFYLMNQKKALTKFLKCLNWELSAEVKQALELLSSWQPMDIQDALELLSPQFTHAQVRRYAVSRLQQAPDEDLLLYLLQLVQALKYENHECINPSDSQTTVASVSSTAATTTSSSPATNNHCDLATFLIDRCVADDVLANYFYWYMVVEIENYSLNVTEINTTQPHHSANQQASNESGNKKPPAPYMIVMDRFMQKLASGNGEMIKRRNFILRQRLFVDKLVQLMKMVAKESKNRLGKIEKLKELLADSGDVLQFDFKHFDPPLALPLDPHIEILGVIPEAATLFKSQLMPCRLTLKTAHHIPSTTRLPTTPSQTDLVGSSTSVERSRSSDHLNMAGLSIHNKQLAQQSRHLKQVPTTGSLPKTVFGPLQAPAYSEYNIIFKHGDDLRQDQLILQTITLMDKLLRRENLDLKLTPYRVLATSTRHGFVQYVDSISVAEVRATEGSIQNFFRRYAPSPDAQYGILPEVMDTYIRSCAGYCVITYLLGVGDRHLDNLLLTKTGKLFHIDFGYILGRDPKPLPPPMKLTREMVEAMGGPTSDLYQQFLKLCHTAYLHLRRHSSLILNLFSLMVDANVPDIALEPDKTVKKVQDKFRLDLSDEEAVHYMQNLIDISVSDVMAVLVEQIHKIAQYWRK